MNKSQERAVRRIDQFLEEQIEGVPKEKYGAKVVDRKVHEVTKGTFFMSAQTEYLGLPENNVLRFMSHYYWLFRIGPRGSITMLQGAKSFEQFKGKGKLAFGFTVERV
jgi:hypothetical protein